ncbi:ABC transporter permease [bacterium]|nr:ABC transporter permease [bacterium]
MKDSANFIPIINLVLVFIPLTAVILIHLKWELNIKTLIYASSRMIIQLIFMGYALIIIFNNKNLFLSSFILTVMLLVSAWIALRPLNQHRSKLFSTALIAISSGAIPVLALIIGLVVQLKPWYAPRYLIPLAGMIFANAMNSVSLCAERFFSEKNSEKNYIEARNAAYKTALLPLINSFFAVGLVSIPGMMTGQILAGVSPLLAVRYQIMVMCMLLSASGISSAVFLELMKKKAHSPVLFKKIHLWFEKLKKNSRFK